MTTVVEPALRAFRPELLFVSCGYDASGFDSMARMDLHSESFRSMTERMLAMARELCDGKLVVVHEGGYSEFYVPFCGLSVVEALSGHRTAVQDPYLESFLVRPGQNLVEHQKAAVDRVVQVIGRR